MLTFKVSVRANQQCGNADGQKCRPKRFSNVPQAKLGVCRRAGIDGDVEAEELCYANADGGEGEAGAEPGKECAFCVT